MAYRDDAEQHFVFAICPNCSHSLARLPVTTQQKRLAAAVRTIAGRPEPYRLHFFNSAAEAKLYAVLEADRLARESRPVRLQSGAEKKKPPEGGCFD